MGTSERRQDIIKSLCRNRFATVYELAQKYNVNEKTIRRDIDILSLTYPIYTKSGMHGGIFVTEDYNMDRAYMTFEETELLKSIKKKADKLNLLSKKEEKLFASLISIYSNPRRKDNKYDEKRKRAV